jgi:hypothetical protein
MIEIIEAPEYTRMTTAAWVIELMGLTVPPAELEDFTASLNRLIDSASSFISNYTGRKFAEQTVKETVAGSSTNYLLTSVRPVTEIVAVTVGGAEIPVESVKIESADAGILYRGDGWARSTRGTGILRDFPRTGGEVLDTAVTYKAGYTMPESGEDYTFPRDLEDTCAWMVAGVLRNRGGNPIVQSRTLGDASVTFRRLGLQEELKERLAQWVSVA